MDADPFGLERCLRLTSSTGSGPPGRNKVHCAAQARTPTNTQARVDVAVVADARADIRLGEVGLCDPGNLV